MIKGAYKDYDELRTASTEPIIAEPHVDGGISIDSSYRYYISNYSYF
jgi:TAK1-binding protein 1